MGKISISLSDKDRAWAEAQVKSGDYADIDAYFADVLARDQARQAAEAELRAMMDDAEASGISDHTAQEIWAEAEARHRARRA